MTNVARPDPLAKLISQVDGYIQRLSEGSGVGELLAFTQPDEYSEKAVVIAREHLGWLKRHRLAADTGLYLAFSGGMGNDVASISFELFDRWNLKNVPPCPPEFSVLAVLTAFNEDDILKMQIERLLTNGVRVHVIDNWSTDSTPDILSNFAEANLITWERFPKESPSEYFELEQLLSRVEKVTETCGADWVIHHDVDEIRQSPWKGVALKDAFWAVEHWGFNCVDHTVFNFRPVENSWKPGDDLAAAFEWCEFGDTPADFLQIKAWKPALGSFAMARSAGHEVQFEGRHVFPYKFLLRHYPIRSQEHGERKILKERKPRWSPEERKKGWHVHYDHYDESTSFLWDQNDLLRWSEIDKRFLLQRLTGVGMPNNPWEGEGPLPPLT